MGWLIRVGRLHNVRNAGFERSMNADVITSTQCLVTSTPCHAVAQWSCTPNADRTTSGLAGSTPACQAEQVWRNVLSSLVGFD
jgi:hypothetical protein